MQQWCIDNLNLSGDFTIPENIFLLEFDDLYPDYGDVDVIDGFTYFLSNPLKYIMTETQNCYVKGNVQLSSEENYQNTTLYFEQVNEDGTIIVEDETGIKIDSNGDFYKILHGNQFGGYQIRIDFNGEVRITDLTFDENQEVYDLETIDLSSETVIYYIYSNIAIEDATANFTNSDNIEIRETQTIDLKKGWTKVIFNNFELHSPESTINSYYCEVTATGISGETYTFESTSNYTFNNETDCYENDDIELIFDNKLLHSDYNWESFPKLNRTGNNPVLSVPLFESIYPAFTGFVWDGNDPTDLQSNIWSDETATLQSSDGGKLQALPAMNRFYEASGTRLSAGTSVNLDAGWNWIGYWLPHSQMCDVAFGDDYDKVEKIKSEDWYVDKRNNIRDGSSPLPSYSPKPLHYGEGYYVFLTESIDNFQWYNEDASRSENFERKDAENYDAEKKADYEVIDVINIDSEIQEIGVFENGICVGEVEVDENSEQILIYSDRMNRESNEFTFEVITGRGDSQPILDYKIYDENAGDFTEGVILSGHQEYSIIKLGKRGENNFDNAPIKESIIHSSFPNPFNPKTTILFDLPNAGNVDISIFNVKGQKIRSLVSSFKEQGSHSIVWNGNDDNGNNVSSGLFFYKIKTVNETAVSKLLMLK
ncbi:MAG: T9SS type A sorting domain-containing protein, partial [Candidatus Cloacimonadota bacterium]|nr:T9SS type A sorting domain-containing protein [Candidatus Cloacimonadota bacterium]